ncbi:MAG TPA: hypothetical protein VNZ22_12545, partial [Bacillota bacterium]|nr:hypothetical protein [Bacillota bacterium]
MDAVVNRVIAPGAIGGMEARRVADKLDKHVDELLRGWPWMPFQHTLGISGYEVYFNHPDELFYALALALPYLEPPTADRAKALLNQQLSQCPPYALAGWDNRTGQPRESYDVPSGLRLLGQGKATSAFGVYAFWAWCHYAHDSAAAKSHWPAVRARMQPLLAADYRFDAHKTDYTRDEAQTLNGDLAGLIGLARLARLNDDAETAKAARLRLEQVLALRINLERVNPKFIEKTSASKSLHIYKLARYCDLVPEVGQGLRRLTDGCAAARLKSFREQRNGW